MICLIWTFPLKWVVQVCDILGEHKVCTQTHRAHLCLHGLKPPVVFLNQFLFLDGMWALFRPLSRFSRQYILLGENKQCAPLELRNCNPGQSEWVNLQLQHHNSSASFISIKIILFSITFTTELVQIVSSLYKWLVIINRLILLFYFC